LLEPPVVGTEAASALAPLSVVPPVPGAEIAEELSSANAETGLLIRITATKAAIAETTNIFFNIFIDLLYNTLLKKSQVRCMVCTAKPIFADLGQILQKNTRRSFSDRRDCVFRLRN
jgi:hypothetical protein